MSRELMNQYAEASRNFQRLVSGISSGDLIRAPKAGEWSAGFVVHHMADAEVQFATRFMNALAEVKPNIVPFNEEVYPDSLNYSKRSVKISQDTCSAIGAFIFSILENISEQDWGRVSLHPDLGEMSISDLLAKVVSHYQAHIGQLKEIIESL